MILSKLAISKHLPVKRQLKKVGPIGMDVGTDAIHLCQLQPLDAKRYAVVAKRSIAFSGTRKEILSSSVRLKKLLSQGMKKQGFIGRKLVTVMPADELKMMPVTYNAKTQNVDKEILKALTSRIDGDVGNYSIDYMLVRSNPDDEEHLALAAIAQKERVFDFLDVVTHAGFEVGALDVGPAAIRRFICSLCTEDRLETVLVVNTGLTESYLTVISGRRLMFDQQVRFGEALLLETLSNTLEVSVEEGRDLLLRYGLSKDSEHTVQTDTAMDEDVSDTLIDILKPSFIKLVDEINRVLIFTASQTHGMPINRFFLLGSIARWPGAELLLHQLVDIPYSANREELVKCFVDMTESGESLSTSIPALAIATGLALRGLNNHE